MDIRQTILKFRNMADFLAEHRAFLESLPTEKPGGWGWDSQNHYYTDKDGNEASYVSISAYGYYSVDLTFYGPDAKQLMTQVRRHFGGEWEKRASGETFTLTRAFGTVRVELDVNRAKVCTPRQTGTRTVEKRDPEIMAEVPMITVEEPVIEWDCDPVLSGENEPAEVS